MLVSWSWPTVFLHGMLSVPVVPVVVLLPGILGRIIVIPKREPSLGVKVLLRSLHPIVAV